MAAETSLLLVKKPPIRNVCARFYYMAAETSFAAKGPVTHGFA